MRRMLINVREPEESRIAVVDGDRLEEIYIERSTERRLLGNIYKAQVINVEPSFQAAFVDFAADVNGFLHASDVMPIYSRNNHMPDTRTTTGRRDIASLLRPRQEVLVQVTKDAIGTKGPSLSTYISLPGRYLVLMPSISRCGVSKKIESEQERRKLKTMLDGLNPPRGMGFIVRTAGLEKSVEDLQRDLDYLLRVWRQVAARVKTEASPVAVYQESDLVTRAVRDFLTPDIGEVVVDSPEGYRRAREFIDHVLPEGAGLLRIYEDALPLFDRYRIEPEIEKIYRKRVPLNRGGSLIIDQTEALVAIDVNSGKFKGGRDAETTAYETNLEAVPEIARQLRLRDIGGIVVVDFIDMVDEKKRRAVERALREEMAKDKARTRVGHMSQFCMVEMTRQRVRHSLKILSHEICPMCEGSGYVKTAESMALRIVRMVKKGLARREHVRAEVDASPGVAAYLQNRMRRTLLELEDQTHRQVDILVDPDFENEDFKLSFVKADGKRVVMDGV
ncbi:MAG: Rne/Rng family ribonuclease [Planctomycetes bacterium]|nr:Rne/Rng family ribonuclease [Planctomycetota bacterium]